MLVMILGILVIQFASFGIVVRQQESDIRARMLDFMRADITLAQKVLAASDAGSRQEWVAQFNRGFYEISIAERGTLPQAVEIGRFPALDDVAAGISISLGLEDVRWFWAGEGRNAKPLLEVPLDDVHVLLVDAENPLPSPSTWWSVSYMAILMLATCVLSWLAMNLVLLPLHQLCDAAYQLGKNIEGAPIEEGEGSEVKMTVRALNSIRCQALQLVDERTQMLAAVSHDLQTPITRLRLLAELVDPKPLRGNLIENLRAMSQLVSEGLEYAQSGQIRVEPVRIDLDALVYSIVSEMADAGHSVTVEGSIVRKYIGGLQGVRRSLQNLADNALKYGGSVHFKLTSDATAARIRIIDNGPGIEEHMLEKVFTPFFRLESSHGRTCGGTGLGLPIARNLIRAHGGEVSLHNRMQGGMEAIVELRWVSRFSPLKEPRWSS